jgi:hypothetical protein
VTAPLVVTPFLGAVIPIHDYEFLGHTAVGRQVSELRTGVNLGRLLDPVLPDAYAQARYAFALREEVLGFGFNYSFVDLELGYFVTPSVTLRLFGSWQIAHDGIRDEDYPEAALVAADWPEFLLALDGTTVRGQPGVVIGLHHDQIELQNSFDAGVGASVAVTPSLELGLTAFQTFSAKGGMGRDVAVSVGATWSLSPERLIGRIGEEPRVRPGAP